MIGEPASLTDVVEESSCKCQVEGAQLYRINPAASSVHILVYRGGTMAKIGHNHVISSTDLAGYVAMGTLYILDTVKGQIRPGRRASSA